MRKHIFAFIALTVFALTAAACGFNLAGDVTPPPGWKPSPIPPTVDTANLYPALPPNPVIGEAIYQQQCEECHGPKALGDGPQAAKLGITPAALASQEEVVEDPPLKRFLVLTHGKEEDGMPSFAGKLTTRQRWDVLAYVYTLSVTPEKLERGKSLYAQRCVACHGKDGKGKNLTDQKRMANFSDEDIAEAITGKQHPPDVYSGLSDEDRLALAAYVRLLSFAGGVAKAAPAPTATSAAATATPAAAQTAAATATQSAAATAQPTQQGTVTITGTVTNGTAGGSVPEGLEVELQGYDNPDNAPKKVVDLKTKIDAQDKFRFENVPNAPGRLFFVTTTYKGVLYGSHGAVFQHDTNSLDLPIVIYDTTTDKSKLTVDRLHLFVDYPGDKVYQIIEMYVIANNGDKTVVAEKKGEPVLTFELPQGATHLQFQDGALGGRYVKTDKGFGDTAPIYPQGQTQEVFAYYLASESDALEFKHTFPLPVDSVVVMVPEGKLRLKGDTLQDNGVQTDAQGQKYHIYITPAIAQGKALSFKVIPAKKGGLNLPSGSRRNLAFGLVVLGLALIAVAVVLTRRSRAVATEEAPPYEDDPEMLMDAILALDDLYKEGKLDEEAYQKRRADLKSRLKAALEAQSGEAEE